MTSCAGGFYQAKAAGFLREGGPRRHHQDGGRATAARQARPISTTASGPERRRAGCRSRWLPPCSSTTSTACDPQGRFELEGLKDKTLDDRDDRPGHPWWPWLKSKYGLQDLQVSCIPSMSSRSSIRRRPSRPSPAPRAVHARAAGRALQLLPLRRRGLSALRHARHPHGCHRSRRDVVEKFVRASIEGWKSSPTSAMC